MNYGKVCHSCEIKQKNKKQKTKIYRIILYDLTMILND